MKSFKEFIAEDGVDYFVVELPESIVPNLALLNEDKWVQSGKKDWMQRVDAKNPSIKQLRHVHVAKVKHISTKNMQVSWNKDGTKHDSKNFNLKIGSLNVVQSIARKALDLPADVKLEEATKASGILMQLNESTDISFPPVLFKLKVA